MHANALTVAPSQLEAESKIRDLISAIGLDAGASILGRQEDLFDAGLTSHASVRLMLALEDAFDVEFPDEMLQREYFSSVAAIAGAISQLLGADEG